VNRGNRFLTALAGSTLFLSVSYAIALGFLAKRNWFGSGDLPAFRFWTALAAALVFPILVLLSSLSRKWSTVHLFLWSGACGLVGGYAWTLVVAAYLGPWIRAFSVPVLYCWTVGSLAAFLGVAALWRRGTWPAGLGASAALAVLVFVVLRWLSTPPPDLIVYLKAGATNDDVNQVWSEVLQKPHPSGNGRQHLEGIRSLSRADGADGPGIRVGFQPGTSRTRRAQIRTAVLASPLVARAVDANALPVGQVQANVSSFGAASIKTPEVGKK
jgi:hypothetical protein